MTPMLRKLRGAIGIGLLRGTAWAALLVTIGLIIGALDPASIDSGEESLPFAWIGLRFGFVSGVAFAILLTVAEGRRTIRDLSLWRVTLWGVLGAAAFPLLTPMNDALLFTARPLGAACAARMRPARTDGRMQPFEATERDPPNRCCTTPREWLESPDRSVWRPAQPLR
jgi:hypothetical protein